MDDNNRFGHNNSNRNILHFDAGQNGRVDLFLRSESPRVQQILLHQKLKEDIDKNSARRIRYVDSELYLRNKNKHGKSSATNGSEVQVAKLNIGLIDNNPSNNKQSTSKIPATAAISPTFTTTTINKTNPTNDMNIGSEINNHQDRLKSNIMSSSTSSPSNNNINKNCQVCLIKEVRQDLVNINKIVQERNEQITKLKDKCLRSYFERQMID